MGRDLVVAHAIATRPGSGIRSIVNVSCSTFDGSVSFCIGTLPTSLWIDGSCGRLPNRR
jgi:hypothetical protein